MITFTRLMSDRLATGFSLRGSLVPLLDLCRDLHFALRLLRRNPGYALAAMFCLALGIGVNSTVFSLLDGMYFRLLPVPGADRIVTIDRDGSSPLFWRDYQTLWSGLHAFSGLAASVPRGTFMDVDRANFEITAEAVSANYARALQLNALTGRWFLPADESPGAEPTVVISAALWRTYFHRDPAAAGKYVRIENQWYRVVGVAPENFRGVSPPVEIDAWLPLVTYPIFRPQLAAPLAPGPAVNLVGRLADRVTLARANAELAVADAHLREADRAAPGHAAPMAAHFFRGIVSPESRRAIRPLSILLLAVVVAVLLIACVNVANLLLSRAAVRKREMALRRALGASRARLLRQSFAESLILALGGAALGILCGSWTDRILSTSLPASIPRSVLRGVSLEMSGRVALFTTAVALLCAILFSLAPALEAPSARRSRQRNLYVVAQVALSLVLLVAAGLLLRALQRTAHIDPGFATEHRFYLRLFTPEPDFTPDSSTRLFTRLLDQARALPGVRAATLSFDVLGFNDTECVSADRASDPARTAINVVEPNYFAALEIPLLRGRTFASSDLPNAPRVIVVNETMARRRWPGQDPIGRTVWMGCGDHAPRVAAQVIGVVRDSKYGSLDEAPKPFFYLSRLQFWWNGFFALIVHTAGDPAALAESLLRLARAGGPNVRIYEMRTFDETVALSLWRVRWQATLLGAFGLLALALSMIGLYGVVAYSVAQRTHEIGIRMALGAQTLDIRRMVLARALRLTAAGIAVGLLLSAVATRCLTGFLYGVNPLDPAAFTAAALTWVVIALLASYLPAARAARVDPSISLRAD